MENKLTINDETKEDGRTTVLNSSFPKAGQYWLEKETNKVRLLSKIKYVDDFPHTIYVESHPEDASSSTTLLLYNTFINEFSFAFDGEKIREQEILKINSDIAKLQQEMSKLIAEPLDSPMFRISNDNKNLPVTATHILTEEALGAISQVANSEKGIINVLESGNLTTEYLQDMKLRMDNHLTVATVKSNMIEETNKKIFSKMETLGNFFKEKAQAELAKTQDVQDKIASLNKGLKTLSLYLGEDVVVTQLKEGSRTTKALPVYLFQAKRFIDEEIAIFTEFDKGDFDFSYDKDFYKLIEKNPDFVNALIPAEKGLVVVAWRRYSKEYRTNDYFSNQKANDENKRSWLLFRDGECVWAIDSPIISHNEATTLFSTEEEMTKIFKDWDRKEITYNNIHYTDALEKQENVYLHYKRFAILLSGLHDHNNFLGNLPVDAHNGKLFLPSVQEKVYIFVRDAEKDFMLGQGLVPYKDWITKKNKYLSKGSRVAFWATNESMDYAIAPGAWSRSYNKDMNFYPDNRVNIDIVSKKDSDLIISIPCSNGYTETTRNVTIYLNKIDKNSLNYLCLDMVTTKELSDYIHDRASRSSYMDYLPLFKDIKAILEKEEPQLEILYSYFSSLLDTAGICFPPALKKEDIIKDSMRLWRNSKNHIMPPALNDDDFHSFEKDFCDIVYSLIGHGRNLEKEVEELVLSMGRTPLRLVLNGKNQNIVYTTILDEEKPPIKSKFNWVAKFKLRLGKTKVSIQEKIDECVLLKNNSMETTLHDWDSAEPFLTEVNPTFNLNTIREVYNTSLEWEKDLIEAFKLKDISNDDFEKSFKRYRFKVNKLKGANNSYFSDIIKQFPIGLYEYNNSLHIIYLGIIESTLYLDGTKEREEILSKWYKEHVSNSEDFFRDKVLSESRFGLFFNAYHKRTWKNDIITEYNHYGPIKLGHEFKEEKSFTDFITTIKEYKKVENIWFVDDINKCIDLYSKN